ILRHGPAFAVDEEREVVEAGLEDDVEKPRRVIRAPHGAGIPAGEVARERDALRVRRTQPEPDAPPTGFAPADLDGRQPSGRLQSADAPAHAHARGQAAGRAVERVA